MRVALKVDLPINTLGASHWWRVVAMYGDYVMLCSENGLYHWPKRNEVDL